MRKPLWLGALQRDGLLFHEALLMPEFHYAALNESGHRFAGTLEAEDKTAALSALTERYAVVTRLERKTGKVLFASLFSPIKNEDLLNFSQTLAAMVEGGIPLKRELYTIYHDVQNRAMLEIILALSTQLGAGDSLSEAMQHHPQVFDSFFINMVKAGEDSGNLPEMLHRVSGYLEKTEALKDTVKSSLTYPLVIFVFAGFLVGAILAFGVPYLRDLYNGLGIELPAATKLLVLVGGFLGDNLFLCFLGLLVLSYGVKIALSKPYVLRRIDLMKLTLPKIGPFFRVFYTARLSRTLALLYSSGVPLLNSLKLAADSVGNQVVSESMLIAEDSIKSGEALSACLRENPYFLDSAIGMVAAGEESGKLDVMLEKVATFYEHKVNNQLDALTSTIEPLMMIGIGIVIGGIIITLGFDPSKIL